jgi:anti-sigma factor RsiW
MNSEMNTLKCGRENDLVGFLYGELDPREEHSFRRHMQECPECGSQLSAFSDIRKSVVSWRNEALGSLTPSVEHPGVTGIDRARPSAMAAVREFFNLSPLWMKGTIAFASLLFCLFAVLAIVRFMEAPPKTHVVNKVENTVPSAQQLDSEVQRRVKEELERRDASQNASTSNASAVGLRRRPLKGNKQFASTAMQRKAGRPLSKLERQELAADLRLTTNDGDDLVLIGDRINQ